MAPNWLQNQYAKEKIGSFLTSNSFKLVSYFFLQYICVMRELDDKHLVQQLKAGNKAAFQILFERYYSLFLTFSNNLLKDSIIAEDLLQNVFIKIWVGRANINPNKNFKNYLLVAVRNEIYQYFRSAFKAQYEELSSDILDQSFNADTMLSAKELEAKITSIVLSMPQRRREIFNMSRSEKLSNMEIAERLGISVRTVEKHIENALADLRKNLSLPIAVIIMLLW